MTAPTTTRLVPVAAPTRLADDEAADVRAAIERVVRDGPWIGGVEVERFEESFTIAAGLAHVVGVANGTDALVVAMIALGLPAGSGVLIAANEGGYAATAARLAGLVPVTMDVAPGTLAPTAESADRAWRSGASAIVVTHLHGDPVPLRELNRWRRERGLRLIEDCAQAHGAVADGAAVGSIGDAAAFSFYPTKNLGAVGDAGAVAFAEPDAAARARRIARYGWGERFRVDVAGGRNSRLDPLQAAVLTARLPYLERRTTRRRAIAQRYRDALAGTPIRILGDPDTTVAHHAVVVAPAGGRDRLDALLGARGIATAVHYPFLLGEMPGLAIAPGETPVAADARDRILTIPCFPELTDDEVDRVAGALAEAVAR